MPCPLAQGHPQHGPNPSHNTQLGGNIPKLSQNQLLPPGACRWRGVLLGSGGCTAREWLKSDVKAPRCARGSAGAALRGALPALLRGSASPARALRSPLPQRKSPGERGEYRRAELSDSSRLGKTGDVEVSLFRRLPQRTNLSLCGD